MRQAVFEVFDPVLGFAPADVSPVGAIRWLRPYGGDGSGARLLGLGLGWDHHAPFRYRRCLAGERCSSGDDRAS